MKKGLSRILSLVLALSLVLGMGVFQMATTAFAVDGDPVTSVSGGKDYYIINRATGKYLDAGSNTLSAFGDTVTVEEYSGMLSQQWTLVPNGDGYQVVPLSDMSIMLNVTLGLNYDGNNITARTFLLIFASRHRFNFEYSNGSFHIVSDRSAFSFNARCLGLDGTDVVLRNITDDEDRKWDLIEIDDSSAEILDHLSDVFNQKTAAWTMDLAYAAYNPLPPFIPEALAHVLLPGPVMTIPKDETADKLLRENGYTVDPIYGYDPCQTAAHVIGHKQTLVNGVSRPLIAVVVRGSVTWNDWGMNFRTQLDWFPYKEEFEDGKNKVLANLKQYIYDKNLTDPVVLITGHSLGAAIANLLAADLMTKEKWSQENVYAYTFATPRVQDNNVDPVTIHPNIFNILNRNDFVTYIPNSRLGLFTNGLSLCDSWKRHGEDYNVIMPLTGKLFGFIPVGTIFDTAPVGLFGHLMSVYSSWIHAQRARLTEAQLKQMSKDAVAKGFLPRLISAKCPVDITLYDNDGNVIAEVVNNVVTRIAGGEVTAWVTEEGEKNFFLPHGMDVSHAEVVATDNGTMKFGIATLDADSDDMLHEIKTVTDILLEKGREYYVDLSEDIAISDVRMMVTENGEIIGEVAADGVTTVPVKGITIEGDHQRILTVGDTTLLTVAYKPTLPTNRTIIWTSSNEAVATVDINGVVTAHSVGGAIITGTSQDGGYKDQCIISVEPATEISIDGDPTIILNFGQQHQLSATVTVNSVSRPITWSSNNEAVAMVSSSGLVTGLSLGSAIITATTKDGKTARVTVNVENKTAITIMGDPTRILTLGQQHQLIATVTNNSTALPITWSSSNEAVAPVTASGIVSALSVGSAMITATTKDGYVAQVMITVEAKTGITIVGDPARILTLGQQHQLTADVTNNSTALPISWSSSNQAVAPVSATGLVTAQSLGSAIITATTKDGYTAQVLVTVEAGTVITIAGDPTRILKLGQQHQLTANVTQNSAALPIVWSSNNEAVATVSANGLVSALSLGSAMITATTKDGKTAQIMVTVEASTAITIPGDFARILTLGQQYQLTADVTPNSTSLPVTWSSSNQAIVPVTANGLITGLSLGSAVITATTKDGYSAQVMVTVEAKTVITIAGDATRIAALGTPLQLTANVTQNSTALPLTWASSNAAVATVAADGLVTPKAVGSTMITVTTKDGYSAQVMVTVETPTTISIAGAATRIIALGLSEQLVANVSQNSTALPLTWTSSNTAVATVNEYGIVTSKAVGSTMITVTTKDGKSAQVMVTVEAPTTISISGKPSGNLTVGKPHQLTANVPHNSTALPITWTSSNEAVATISASGLITPKAPGNTIITATTKDGVSEQFIVTVVKQEFWLWRWLKTFFGWLAKPFIWLWNAISYPFRKIGKL